MLRITAKQECRGHKSHSLFPLDDASDSGLVFLLCDLPTYCIISELLALGSNFWEKGPMEN